VRHNPRAVRGAAARTGPRVTLALMQGRAQNVSAVFRLLFGFFVLSILTGLLVAGIGIPAVGAVGSVAKGGVAAFNDLPSKFDFSPLAQQSRILDADDGLIANPYDENRIVVGLDAIAPIMQKAQIAIEDSRFYQHGGLDVRGFTRAMLSNFSGGEVQGASTLTQQYVKITLQENALRRDDKEAAQRAVAKNYMRKLQELKYSLNVEENLTKDQILAGYLNLVYYGDQAYGVEAASQNYFGIPAKELNLGQAALLAGIVQQPTKFNPVLNPKDSQARRDVVLSRMQVLGMASPEEVAEAKKIDVTTMIHKKAVKGVCARSSQPYFCSYVMAFLEKSPSMAVLGATPAERLKNVNQGGLTIRTTLKPGLQQFALDRLTEAVPLDAEDGIGGAATVVEPGTGKVLAMAQTSTFDKTQVVWNADQAYGGGPSGWQIGSAAKTYVLVAALEQGIPLNSTINAPQAGPRNPFTYTKDMVHDDCGMSDPWPVANDYQTGGNIPLQTAISQSINTAFASLALRVGGCAVRDTMTKMGLHQGNGKEVEPFISSILGTSPASPMTVASSYATFAARGNYCEPTPIVSITTWDKKEIPVPASTCKQVITPEVADGINQLLQGPLRNGTAAGLWGDYNHPGAGKTGTTDNNNQLWFAGYTPQLSTAVWVGNILPAIPNSGGKLKTLNYRNFGIYGWQGEVFGGSISAPIWSKIMGYASQDLPAANFTPPPQKILNGDIVNLPYVTGMSVANATAALQAAGFTASVSGRIDSGYPAGLVAGTDPAWRAPKGTNVGLLISTGVAAAPEPSDDATPSPEASRSNRRGNGNGNGNTDPPTN